MVIPSGSVYSVEQGDAGLVVWAVQNGLNDVGFSLEKDGVFGTKTEVAVENFQENTQIKVDGQFGPTSSKTLCAIFEKRVKVVLPTGLQRSVIHLESGSLIGAVNWNVAGGVDCSYVQRRVYQIDYSDQEVIKSAFDGAYQVEKTAQDFRTEFERFDKFVKVDSLQLAWKLAVLDHNYPALAEQIARYGINGLSGYYTSPQTWVINAGRYFADGTQVRTPLEWGQHYALGSKTHNHKGLAVRYVENWNIQ